MFARHFDCVSCRPSTQRSGPSLENQRVHPSCRIWAPTTENFSDGTFRRQLKATVEGRPWTSESTVLGGVHRGTGQLGPARGELTGGRKRVSRDHHASDLRGRTDRGQRDGARASSSESIKADSASLGVAVGRPASVVKTHSLCRSH